MLEMKKCCNCRSDLPESNGTTGGATVQCEKCQRNELKYGKAETCMYCQLPAAFRNQRCVHCCHAERKYGPPSACVNCKLKAAFPNNHAGKNGGYLCRMCLMQRKASLLAAAAVPGLPGIPSSSSVGPSTSLPLPRLLQLPGHPSRHSSHHGHHHHRDVHGHKRRHNHESREDAKRREMGPLAAAVSDDVLAMQKLNDRIQELTSQNAKKEALILERDKTIAALRGDMQKMERSHREKVQQLEKAKEDAVRATIEKLKAHAKAERERQQKEKKEKQSS